MPRTRKETDPLEMLMRMAWLLYGMVLANTILVLIVSTMSDADAKVIVMAMSFSSVAYVGFAWFLEWLYNGYKETDEKFDKAMEAALDE